jgi:hypothetical protein
MAPMPAPLPPPASAPIAAPAAALPPTIKADFFLDLRLTTGRVVSEAVGGGAGLSRRTPFDGAAAGAKLSATGAVAAGASWREQPTMLIAARKAAPACKDMEFMTW